MRQTLPHRIDGCAGAQFQHLQDVAPQMFGQGLKIDPAGSRGQMILQSVRIVEVDTEKARGQACQQFT